MSIVHSTPIRPREIRLTRIRNDDIHLSDLLARPLDDLIYFIAVLRRTSVYVNRRARLGRDILGDLARILRVVGDDDGGSGCGVSGPVQGKPPESAVAVLMQLALTRRQSSS